MPKIKSTMQELQMQNTKLKNDMLQNRLDKDSGKLIEKKKVDIIGTKLGTMLHTRLNAIARAYKDSVPTLEAEHAQAIDEVRRDFKQWVDELEKKEQEVERSLANRMKLVPEHLKKHKGRPRKTEATQ